MIAIIIITDPTTAQIALARLGGSAAVQARRHIRDDVPDADVQWVPPARGNPHGGTSGAPAVQGVAQ